MVERIDNSINSDYAISDNKAYEFLGDLHIKLFPHHPEVPSILKGETRDKIEQFKYIEERLLDHAEHNPITEETIRQVVKDAKKAGKVNGAANDIEDFLLEQFNNYKNKDTPTLKGEKRTNFITEVRKAIESEKANGSSIAHIKGALTLIEVSSKDSGITAETIKNTISFIQTPEGGYTKLSEPQKQQMEQLLMKVFEEVAKSPNATVKRVYDGFSNGISNQNILPVIH